MHCLFSSSRLTAKERVVVSVEYVYVRAGHRRRGKFRAGTDAHVYIRADSLRVVCCLGRDVWARDSSGKMSAAEFLTNKRLRMSAAHERACMPFMQAIFITPCRDC